MTVLKPDFILFMNDGLYAAGLGVWLSLCYHVFSRLVPAKNIVVGIVSYCLFFCLTGVITFFFIIGRTFAAEPRWFIFFGLCIGMIAYYTALSPFVSLFLRIAFRALRKIKRAVCRGGTTLILIVTTFVLKINGYIKTKKNIYKKNLKNKQDIVYNQLKTQEILNEIKGRNKSGEKVDKKHKRHKIKKAKSPVQKN